VVKPAMPAPMMRIRMVLHFCIVPRPSKSGANGQFFGGEHHATIPTPVRAGSGSKGRRAAYKSAAGLSAPCRGSPRFSQLN
jgi:hypothetical protein